MAVGRKCPKVKVASSKLIYDAGWLTSEVLKANRLKA